MKKCKIVRSKENGLYNKKIDFQEKGDGTANGMLKAIENSLTVSFSFDNVPSFNVDNTKSNFASKPSLYKNIWNTYNKILKSNCYAHILHNYFKHLT